MSDIFIRNARFVLTPSDLSNVVVYEDKDISVENGKITCIGTHCQKPRNALVINASNHVVAPAYINAHTHAGMAFLRGYLPDHEFWDWLRKIQYIEKRIVSRELVFHSSRLSCIEMLMNGVIGFIDMYFYPEETIKACADLGLYVSTGPITPTEEELKRFTAKFEGLNRVIPIINIHSLYQASYDDLFRSFELAEKYGLKVHMHVSETRREVFLIRKTTGQWPIEFLYKKNLLNEKVQLVHLNWVLSTELEYIAEKKASMILCPHSSMRLSVGGFVPVYEAMKRRIPLTVGTDGSSGDRLNVLSEIRELILLYRHNYWDARLKLRETYPYIVVNGYKIMGIRGGYIREGYPAHLVIYNIDLLRNTPITSRNLINRLVLGEGFTPHYVTVNGKIVYDHTIYDKMVEEMLDTIKYLEKLSQKIDYENGELIE